MKNQILFLVFIISLNTFSQNQLIDGTTVFIEKRAKQELQYMFYEKVTKILNHDVTIELLDEKNSTVNINFATIFKNTLNLIKNTDFISHNPLGSDTWNAAFKSDLQGLYDKFKKDILANVCDTNCIIKIENLIPEDISDDENLNTIILKTVNLLSATSNYGELSEVIKNISFIGNFMIDMINAGKEESNVTVESILDKYAAPVGSYRFKQKNKFSIDLNAYPGISFGYEQSNSQSGAFQITAPIGFSFSKKNSIINEIASSSSVFLSVIDLGAPLSYRLKHDDIEGFPKEIEWEQIISPGIFYIYGIRNTPIALSAGLQYMPKLRTINQLQENVVRLSLGVQVDVTIFNLLKKDDKKSKIKRGKLKYKYNYLINHTNKEWKKHKKERKERMELLNNEKRDKRKEKYEKRIKYLNTIK